jgi:hypothetical protein
MTLHATCAQVVCFGEVSMPLEQSLRPTGTAMSILGLNSDNCALAHVHILLKHLSDHKTYLRIQPASSRRLNC